MPKKNETGKVKKLIQPFRQLFNDEASSGLLLLGVTFLALGWANSPWSWSYELFWHQRFLGAYFPQAPTLHFWINEGLMTLFFVMVGLEIKREVVDGELSTIKKASLPFYAALGGMIAPAIFYNALNPIASVTGKGWGIPMATDIAFALGALSLLGKRVPTSLKIFLTALAIIDDIGAIIIIALFYASKFSLLFFLLSIAVCVGLFKLNQKQLNNIWIYIAVGIVLWFCVYKTGIHPSIAGVIFAAFIPFSKNHSENILFGAIEKHLSSWVTYVIMPLFAFANAGVSLVEITQLFNHPISMGILSGLIFGKPLGIFCATKLAVQKGWAQLPKDVNWDHILGVGLLGGIGFTMSLFIANLAFGHTWWIPYAKIGILAGSALSGAAGITLLWQQSRPLRDVKQ